eukprot:COSAG06_NODE_10009_length_1770_cov_1.548773_1_plen_120_part_00
MESTQKESVFSQARAAEEGDDSLPSMFDLPFGEGKVRVTYDLKLRMIILPRQARDNHRKSCEKEWRCIYIIHNDDYIRICIQVLEGDMGGPLLEIIESLSPLASRCDYSYSTKQAPFHQ